MFFFMWTDWADAQADLNLCSAQRSFCCICLEAAHLTETSVSLLDVVFRLLISEKRARVYCKCHHEPSHEI